ncbi:MAG: hypothetical protein K2Q15_05585, partial [Burkholderiales bacterium]|nr:hypothetical protein [Burkholderiales bacterium]
RQKLRQRTGLRFADAEVKGSAANPKICRHREHGVKKQNTEKTLRKHKIFPFVFLCVLCVLTALCVYRPF